jgi:alkylation response protein AidB-like acyl-CoA dehydrogenase
MPDTARFYASELIAGRRFANALPEPTSGNMPLMPLQPAEPVDGGFQLTGTKRFACACEIADHLLINTLVEDTSTFFGLAADPKTMRFIPIWDTMGLRASRSQLIEFTGTLLREDRRCPPLRQRHPSHIDAGLVFLSLGIADAALAEHARRQIIPTTGHPLADIQWLPFDVGNVHTRLEAATMYAQHMCWLADENSAEFTPATLRAKLLANEIAVYTTQLAVRVGGASAGDLRSFPIERLFHDAQAVGWMDQSTTASKNTLGAALLDGRDG